MMNRAALNPTVTSLAIRSNWPLYLLVAALILLVLQLMSGTGAVYALLVFALLVVSYYAVTWAGGLETLFGLALLYLLLEHVLISQIAKVIFWESADAPLRRPLETMGIYVVGMASLGCGVLLNNRFGWRRGPLFVAEMKPSRLLWMSILCTIFFTLLQLVARTVGTDSKGTLTQGGVLGPLKQINFLGPMAIASGTAYIILHSKGRRSMGLINGVPIIIQMIAAITTAAREAIILPVVIYGLTCIAFHYRFRVKHYAILLLGAYIANFIVFPYSLVARNTIRTGSFEKNVNTSASMMMEIIQNPFKYRDLISHMEAKRSRDLHQFDYYDHPSDTLLRVTLFVYADGLVDAAINQGYTGWMTITPGFQASLPHFLNPDKPFVSTGNLLAHREPGMRPNKGDYTTGISVGLFADAYTCFGWLGVSVIPCLLIFCLMTAYRFLIDDRIWRNVLMLSFVSNFSFLAFSEGSTAELTITCIAGSMGIAVGIAVLYLLVDVLDKTTARVQYAASANIHPRQQALQRVLTTTPNVGKSMGIKRSGPPEKV